MVTQPLTSAVDLGFLGKGLMVARCAGIRRFCSYTYNPLVVQAPFRVSGGVFCKRHQQGDRGGLYQVI